MSLSRHKVIPYLLLFITTVCCIITVSLVIDHCTCGSCCRSIQQFIFICQIKIIGKDISCHRSCICGSIAVGNSDRNCDLRALIWCISHEQCMVWMTLRLLCSTGLSCNGKIQIFKCLPYSLPPDAYLPEWCSRNYPQYRYYYILMPNNLQ